MNQNNTYTTMQRSFYDKTADIMEVENHRGHDSNPDYRGILLRSVANNPKDWKGKSALDFGCGIGRNVDNLYGMAEWNRVDGCDISSENILRADKYLLNRGHRSNLFVTTGTTLEPIPNNTYDFVMSTIVLQHIAVHEIRQSLFTDIYRVMTPGALFSFQMAKYGPGIKHAGYYDNVWNAGGTNGFLDVSIDNPDELIQDLVSIGYHDISHETAPEWDANNKSYAVSDSSWIYFKAFKK